MDRPHDSGPHRVTLRVRRPLHAVLADLKAASILTQEGALAESRELCVIGPSNGLKTTTRDKLFSLDRLKQAAKLPLVDVAASNLVAYNYLESAGPRDAHIEVIKAPSLAYANSVVINRMQWINVTNLYNYRLYDTQQLASPITGGQGATGSTGSRVNTDWSAISSNTNRPQMSLEFETAEDFMRLFKSYMTLESLNDRFPRATMFEAILEDGLDLQNVEAAYESLSEHQKALYKFPVHHILEQDWLGRRLAISCDCTDAFAAAAFRFDIGALLTSGKDVPNLMLQGQRELGVAALARLCKELDNQNPAGDGRFSRLLDNPRVRMALSYTVKGGVVQQFEPGQPDPIGYIECIGYDDTNPIIQVKYQEALNRPHLNHIILQTKTVHNDNDLRELMETPQFKNFVAYHSGASDEPCTVGIIITRDDRGYRDILPCVKTLRDPEVCRGIIEENTAGETQLRSGLKQRLRMAYRSELSSETVDKIVAHVDVVMGFPMLGKTLTDHPESFKSTPEAFELAVAATGIARFRGMFLAPIFLVSQHHLPGVIAGVCQQEATVAAAIATATDASNTFLAEPGSAVSKWLQPLVDKKLLSQRFMWDIIERELNDSVAGTFINNLSVQLGGFIQQEYAVVLSEQLLNAAEAAADRVSLREYSQKEIEQMLQLDRHLARFWPKFQTQFRAALKAQGTHANIRRVAWQVCDRLQPVVAEAFLSILCQVATELDLFEDTEEAAAALDEISTSGAVPCTAAAAASGSMAAAVDSIQRPPGCVPDELWQTFLAVLVTVGSDISAAMELLYRAHTFPGAVQDSDQVSYVLEKVFMDWAVRAWKPAAIKMHTQVLARPANQPPDVALNLARAHARNALKTTAQEMARVIADNITQGFSAELGLGHKVPRRKPLSEKLLSLSMLSANNHVSAECWQLRYGSPLIKPISTLSSPTGGMLVGYLPKMTAADAVKGQLSWNRTRQQQLKQQISQLENLLEFVRAVTAPWQDGQEPLIDFVDIAAAPAAAADTAAAAAAAPIVTLPVVGEFEGSTLEEVDTAMTPAPTPSRRRRLAAAVAGANNKRAAVGQSSADAARIRGAKRHTAE